MEHLAFMAKQKYCEICEKGFDTPWNFRRHEEERHTAKNTSKIFARKLKQNESRNISRRKRYANEPGYKEKAKQLGKTSRLNKRATVERDKEGSEDAGDGNNAVKKDKMSNSDPDYEDKVDGNEDDTASSREGGDVADSADGKTGKKTGGFQVKTKLLTEKDLELFFKPRSSAPGSYKDDPKSRRLENLST